MKNRMGALFILLLLPSILFAQSFKVEVMRPEFKFGGGEPTFLTTAWFVGVKVPLPAGITVIGELPFAFGELEGGGVPTEDATIGNPGIGLRFDLPGFVIDAMVRAPIVESGFAGFVGFLADIDRQEAFVPDILPLTGMIHTDLDFGTLMVRPYGGASFNLTTQHDRSDFIQRIVNVDRNDGELFLLYGGEGWLRFESLQFGAALNGRAWLSSGAGFDESTTHQVTIQAKLVFPNVIPGAMVRIPFDDIALDYVAGINCEFSF